MSALADRPHVLAKAYVPDTFGISMFAVGKTFSDSTLQAIMAQVRGCLLAHMYTRSTSGLNL